MESSQVSRWEIFKLNLLAPLFSKGFETIAARLSFWTSGSEVDHLLA